MQQVSAFMKLAHATLCSTPLELLEAVKQSIMHISYYHLLVLCASRGETAKNNTVWSQLQTFCSFLDYIDSLCSSLVYRSNRAFHLPRALQLFVCYAIP